MYVTFMLFMYKVLFCVPTCIRINLICFSFQMFDPSMLDSAIEEICSDRISDDISDEGIDLLVGGID